MKKENHRLFLEQYGKYVREVLRPTNDALRQVFKDWKDPSYWSEYSTSDRIPIPSPIQRAITRIKRPESVVDKIIRKPSSFPDGLKIESVNRMHDAIAGRIIVYFLKNLPLIDKEIRNSEIIEVSSTDMPVAYLSSDIIEYLDLKHINRKHKESGYASIHYIVRFRSSSVDIAERPWFEIQVRTLAEDVWGEIEHILGYKPDKRTSFAVRKQFKIISSQLSAIDDHFNLLYEELFRFQGEANFRDSDPVNAENLTAVLSEVGVSCAQREIDGLLKLLTSRGINNVGKLREASEKRKIDIIRNTYRKNEGRQPSNFEVIAGIAASHSIDIENDISDAIKVQIDFLKAWEKLKQDIN